MDTYHLLNRMSSERNNSNVNEIKFHSSFQISKFSFPLKSNYSSADKAESHSNDESDRKESLASISAEIDKLNAEIEYIKPDSSDKNAGEPEAPQDAQVAQGKPTETSDVAAESVTTNGSTAEDDRMKENIALLLAETTVPDLSDVVSVQLKSGTVKESTADSSAESTEFPDSGSGDTKVQFYSV